MVDLAWYTRRVTITCNSHLGRNLMSSTFLLAAAARRLAVTPAPFQPAACDPRVAAYAESACAAAASALAEGREEEALAAAVIVDLWHPELETDEQRADALNDEAQRERYRGVALRGEYETTSLRGH